MKKGTIGIDEHGSATGNSRPCYVQFVDRFLSLSHSLLSPLSLSLSPPLSFLPSPFLSLSLGVYIPGFEPYFSIGSFSHHGRADQRGFRGPSTSTDHSHCRRRHHCHPTQKGRAALYTMSIYLRQIQWSLNARTTTIINDLRILFSFCLTSILFIFHFPFFLILMLFFLLFLYTYYFFALKKNFKT